MITAIWRGVDRAETLEEQLEKAATKANASKAV
jgi:hypothetical protein